MRVCKLCRLRSGCEDSIAQEWRSIPTRDLSRQLTKTASLVVKGFSRCSLVTRARVERRRLRGRHSIQTTSQATMIPACSQSQKSFLQVILLLRSTCAVMFLAKKNKKNSQIEAPRLQTRSFDASCNRMAKDRCRFAVLTMFSVPSSTLVPAVGFVYQSHCSRCLANRILRGISFLRSQIFVHSLVNSFPAARRFTTLQLWLRFRTVVTLETDTSYLMLRV